MAGGQRPTVDQADHDEAAALVLAWTSTLPAQARLTTLCQLELVGMVTAALGEARARERARLTGQADQ